MSLEDVSIAIATIGIFVSFILGCHYVIRSNCFGGRIVVSTSSGELQQHSGVDTHTHATKTT